MAASDRPLRSQTWFKRVDNSGFEHRTHLKARGGLPELFDGRPVIGVANSASDLVPCNAHLTGLAEWVSRGVLENGGYPLVFPTLSIGDSLMRPSGMLFRNLMSMELEALLRANPIDAVVLLTGCDKYRPRLHDGSGEHRSAHDRRARRRDDQRLHGATHGRLGDRHLPTLQRLPVGRS